MVFVVFVMCLAAAVAQVSNLQPAQNLPFLQPQEVVPPPPQQQEINLSDGRFSYFDIALLKEFAKLNENMLISPLSIKTTLAMVLEGAKGVCADEIQQALRIGSIGEARYYLSNVLQLLKKTRYLESANTVFVSDKVRVFSDYVAKLEEYKGYISPIDFTNVPRAVQTINQWVSEHTRGSIPEIISAENIYKDFVVVIANALHFKGKWKTAFDAKSTRRDWFLTSGKGRQEIFMMQVNNYFNYQFLSDLHAEAVEIPYDEEYSMLIVMPAEGNNIENLATDMHKLSDILDNLNSTELNLSIPKFETEYSKNLIDVLKPLRVRTIFSPEANLTGIVANDNVRVNNIIHKTKIEVDEQGTKAAAATGVIVIPLIGSTARKVTINRPFIYFIYHRNTRTIIFEGIFRSPQNPVQRQAPQTVNLRSNFYNSYN